MPTRKAIKSVIDPVVAPVVPVIVKQASIPVEPVAKTVFDDEPISKEEADSLAVGPDRGWFDTMKAVLAEGTGASWKRIAFTAVACFFTGMGVAFLAIPVIEVLTLAAFMLSGSAVIALLVWFLGIVATLYASYQIGSIVGRSILTGNIDGMAVSAYYNVRGWFKRSDKVPS